jgi:monoamine oxidase
VRSNNSHVVVSAINPDRPRDKAAEYTARAVIITAPLGLLQRGYIGFRPPLSKAKTDAIQRLGMGLLDKAVLHFPKVGRAWAGW